MNQQTAGFREIDHTADWELEVWAPDLHELFKQAAQGMYYLSGTRLQEGLHQPVSFEVQASDPESLLVAFLSELLYYGEQEGLGFDRYDLIIEGERLVAKLGGAPIAEQDKEIKAVTYHNLSIEQSERGLEARLVFDV